MAGSGRGGAIIDRLSNRSSAAEVGSVVLLPRVECRAQPSEVSKSFNIHVILNGEKKNTISFPASRNIGVGLGVLIAVGVLGNSFLGYMKARGLESN